MNFSLECEEISTFRLWKLQQSEYMYNMQENEYVKGNNLEKTVV